jgi:hypothetical protein
VVEEMVDRREKLATAGPDCVNAILGQLPRLFTLVERQELSHPEVVTQLSAWREHLATLDATKFEHISGGCPAWVLERLYLWDREIAFQNGGQGRSMDRHDRSR